LLSAIKMIPAILRKRPRFAVAAVCAMATGIMVFLGLYFFNQGFKPGVPAAEIAPVPKQMPQPPSSPLKRIVGAFKRNQNITDTLVGHGISSQEIFQLVKSTRPVYNLAMIKAGVPYTLQLTQKGEFNDFHFAVDDERYLTISRDASGRFAALIKPFPYETKVEMVWGKIDGSLVAAVLDAGEQELLAMNLAEIFGWDIDFYTDIQRGDAFRALVEKKYLDGEFKKYGAILAAGITNQNKEFSGFRFVDEQGRPAYFDYDGKALKKSFLKSPLKFARVSSRFSNARFHPILRVVRPHLGVDYAAPQGTPVQAVASGTILSAGWNGDGGRTIAVRHEGGYETRYLHLSGFVVRAGQRVAQGDVIGYVGATGLATGPHLDFRILQHGKYVNPLKMIFPPAPPIPQKEKARFGALRDAWSDQLAEVTD
jgi:murein DD-endopeptidase MepM/ murein hydrolase activator NlpD